MAFALSQKCRGVVLIPSQTGSCWGRRKTEKLRGSSQEKLYLIWFLSFFCVQHIGVAAFCICFSRRNYYIYCYILRLRVYDDDSTRPTYDWLTGSTCWRHADDQSSLIGRRPVYRSNNYGINLLSVWPNVLLFLLFVCHQQHKWYVCVAEWIILNHIPHSMQLLCPTFLYFYAFTFFFSSVDSSFREQLCFFGFCVLFHILTSLCVLLMNSQIVRWWFCRSRRWFHLYVRRPFRI